MIIGQIGPVKFSHRPGRRALGSRTELGLRLIVRAIARRRLWIDRSVAATSSSSIQRCTPKAREADPGSPAGFVAPHFPQIYT